MRETMTGAELFRLVMHPRATEAEVAALDLETLTAQVAYRRKRKVPKGALSPDLTDEQIAEAILDYARGALVGTSVVTSIEKQAPGDQLLVCPECGATNPADCLFCLSCGSILEAPGVGPGMEREAERPAEVGIAEAAAVVPEIEQPPLAARGKKRRWQGLIVGCAGVLVLLIAIVVTIEIRPPAPGWLLLQYRLGKRDFSWVALPGADLSRADLSGADLSQANLGGADLSGADLRQTNLGGADLSRTSLGGANLRGANLGGADLSRADLNGANLGGANLRAADLHEADLREANLSRADLRWANLAGADLREADLTGADLSQADLTGAHLFDEQLAQAASLESATMPDGSVHE